MKLLKSSEAITINKFMLKVIFTKASLPILTLEQYEEMVEKIAYEQIKDYETDYEYNKVSKKKLTNKDKYLLRNLEEKRK